MTSQLKSGVLKRFTPKTEAPPAIPRTAMAINMIFALFIIRGLFGSKSQTLP
jgi:hypothetical protein